MNERILAIVTEYLGTTAPRLRSQLVDRLVRDCAIDAEAAKDVVRGLLESRVIDPVTVCLYRASDGRVVHEAGLRRGAAFPVLHPAA